MIQLSRTKKCRTSAAFAIAIGAALVNVSPAPAAFHFWAINEIYTNSTGTLQFIEFFTTSDDQNATANSQVQVFNVGGSLNNIFTIPGNLPSNLTAGHFFLIGTSGIAGAGGPTPDFTMPDGFLFQAGGTLNYIGTVTNNGPYTALPTDGLLSRDWNSGTNSPNTPTNFAFGTGTVPEPSTLILSSVGVGLYSVIQRRWRRNTVSAAPSSE